MTRLLLLALAITAGWQARKLCDELGAAMDWR